MKKLIFLLSILISSLGFSQKQLPSYKLYNNKGKEVKWKKIIKSVSESEIIFFGEYHDNPIAHWFYFEILKNQIENKNKIQVGAEMFERDNQVIINEYLQDIISTKKFEAECRLWPNYKTDYKPTLELCKENNIDFFATNIPRRYASTVYSKGISGLDNLSTEAKNWICPLPFPFVDTLEVYQELMTFSGHGGINLAKAQAIKDATMAHFILKDKKTDYKYFHLNGNKHSEVYQGIVWYLKEYGNQDKKITFHTETNDDCTWKKEFSDKADFILVVNQNIK